MITVNVRLEGPTEQNVRDAAARMGVQISRVKGRGDCWQLYGSIVIPQ